MSQSKHTTLRSGLFKGSMLDLFMNLCLVVVWILFLSPSHPPVDAIPDQSIPPTDQNPGDRPSAGQAIARVSVSKDGTLTIEHQGNSYDYSSYTHALEQDPATFPDHVVFRFPDYPELQAIGNAALQRDAAVSMELIR